MPITTALPIIKPSDAKSWTDCKRRVWLDNRGDLDTQPSDDPFEKLIIDLGVAHEQAVLEELASKKDVHTATSPEHTSELMANQVPVIYQGQLFSEPEGIIGLPDFLILHENGEYQAADAKLALSVDKKEIQVQLGIYRKLLGSNLPAIVFLGNGEKDLIGEESASVATKFASEMRELLSLEEEPAVRYSHSKCTKCPYYAHCEPPFDAREELSLLYGIQGRSAEGLEHAGVSSISELANCDPTTLPDVPFLKGAEKKQRAILQAQSHLSGDIFHLKPSDLPKGHWVHFDIEDNPLTGTGEKHVYLWGFLVSGANGDSNQDRFEYVWTAHESDDQLGWQQFLDQIERYRQHHSDLILAHYSHHERTTIRSYAERYSMEDHPTVVYLLGEDNPLYDLNKPVMESLVLPLQGYGLKDICKHPDLVNFQWELEESGSQWSVVRYHDFQGSVDENQRALIKEEILKYNRDDVRATRALQLWLT